MTTENKPSAIFTPEQKQEAWNLQARFLAGENIPREELIAFLANAKRIGPSSTPAAPKKGKPNESEIDFF